MELEEGAGELTTEQTTEALVKAWAAHEKLLDMLEAAWGIIANADPYVPKKSIVWKETARRWRNKYHELLREETLPPSDQVEKEVAAPESEIQFMDGDPRLERMADEVHQIWCTWMEYMFNQGSPILGNASWVMNKSAKYRWTRQMITPYAQLSEDEKVSDREIARRYLDIALLKENKNV